MLAYQPLTDVAAILLLLHSWNSPMVFSPVSYYNNLGSFYGFSDGSTGKEPICQCRRHKRCGFDSWIREILWRRKWQPTPVFWPDNAMGRGAWRVTAHGVAKGRVWLKLLSTPAEVPLLHCGLQRQRRTVKTAADTGQAMVSWILQERALLSLGGRHHTGRLANRWPMIAKHPAWSWDVFFTVSYCYSYCCC